MKYVTALVLAALLSTPAVRASAFQNGPAAPQMQLFTSWTRYDRIAVELKNGVRVNGTVGDRTNRGVYIEHPPAARTFVAYRTVRTILDPDTGAVVGVPAPVPSDRRWMAPVLVAAGVFVFVVIVTHGLIPLCLFADCR